MSVPTRPLRHDLAALSRAADALARGPADERAWRLRRLIGECAALAAAEGADPLELAEDAWRSAHAAIGPRPRPAASTGPARPGVVLPFVRRAAR
ncbi:MAG TPA: hypothetical protein VEA81_12480 [Burkholderiaceae bacterium]|nr:hypothetical protein [Burkholderiaceae bacterium]